MRVLAFILAAALAALAAPALAVDCPLDLGHGVGWVVFSEHYMIAFRPDPSRIEIGEPFALYSDALWRVLTWSMPTLHARVAADHSDRATPLPMIVDRGKRRHTSGPIRRRGSCGPVLSP